MTNTKLSEAEVHELVMKRFKTMTREEWQARIDATNEAFNHQEALERSYARKVSHSKPHAKSPRKTTEPDCY